MFYTTKAIKHSRRCMQVFEKLLDELKREACLQHSRHLSAKEQLAIFLYICTTGLSNHKAQDRIREVQIPFQNMYLCHVLAAVNFNMELHALSC